MYYFRKVRHNLADLHAFTEVVRLIIAWYSFKCHSPDFAQWRWLYSFEIHAFRHLQVVWNFFTHLFIVFWSSASSPLAQQILLVDLVRNLKRCICMAFKLNMEGSNSQRVRAPTSTVLLTSANTFKGLKWFGLMM